MLDISNCLYSDRKMQNCCFQRAFVLYFKNSNLKAALSPWFNENNC